MRDYKLISSKEDVHDIILNQLQVMKELQYDYNWVQYFDSWDSSDCSQVGLVQVYTYYLIENQTGGVFGERDDSLAVVHNMSANITATFD